MILTFNQISSFSGRPFPPGRILPRVKYIIYEFGIKIEISKNEIQCLC